MTRVGIYTHDFKFYHDIVMDLKRWNLPFFSITDLYDIPPDINVIMSSINDAFTLPGQIKARNSLEGIRKCLPMLLNREEFNKIIIGIDPGPRPGVAVMADGVLMEAWECPVIANIRESILHIIGDYRYRYIMIKIGNGDRPNRDAIIKHLKNLAPVIIVNEENTSTPHKVHDNALSAARISLIDDRYDISRTPVKFSRKNIYEKEFITLHSLI
jgi:hypothetical protein